MVEEQSLYFRTDKKTLPKRTYKPDTLLDNLVKRRKLELEVGHPSFAKNQHVETSAQACQKQVDANVTKALPKMEERTIKSSGITFSVSRAVAGFINLNSRDAALIRDKDILNTTSEKDEKPRIVEETLYEDDSYGSFNFSAPRQNVSKNSSQGCFILSSTAYKQRQLIRQIRERLPRARLIERDFNSSLAISRQHNKKTNSNFASEADVLISPRTGLVLTTLQRLKQRALPGQRITVSPVKERLKALSGKYEQLILLIGKTGISDAEVDNFSQLDESDCKALANMQGFGMQLECELIINFALGGKAELIEWTIAVMHKYSVSNNISNNLLEDESPQEIFLRHAGLNAFAAQVVLAFLYWKSAAKSAEIEPEISQKTSQADMNKAVTGSSALHTLATWTSEERLRRLSPFIGERVVRQLDEMLDSSWAIPTCRSVGGT